YGWRVRSLSALRKSKFPRAPDSLEPSHARRPSDQLRSMRSPGLPVSACSLNPILPGARSTRTFAGFASSSTPCAAPSIKSAESLGQRSDSTGFRVPCIDCDAVSTYNLGSCGPENPGDPQEGVAVQSCLRPLGPNHI